MKDETAFRTWGARRHLEIYGENTDHPGHFALFPSDDDEGAFPRYDSEQEAEIDFVAELAAHLAADSVAVILETGAEKLRYLIGHAIAVDAHGERVELDLDAIYLLAAQAFGGAEPTRAEY